MSCTAEGSLHCWTRFCMAWTASSISWALLAFSWPETNTIPVIKYTVMINGVTSLSVIISPVTAQCMLYDFPQKINQAFIKALLAMAFPISIAYWLRSRVTADSRQEMAVKRPENVLFYCPRAA